MMPDTPNPNDLTSYPEFDFSDKEIREIRTHKRSIVIQQVELGISTIYGTSMVDSACYRHSDLIECRLKDSAFWFGGFVLSILIRVRLLPEDSFIVRVEGGREIVSPNGDIVFMRYDQFLSEVLVLDIAVGVHDSLIKVLNKAQEYKYFNKLPLILFP